MLEKDVKRELKSKEKDNIYGRIPYKLSQIRGYFRISMGKMARELGMKKTTYGKNENGVTLPKLTTIVNIYETLGISLDWLLLNRGPMLDKDRRVMGPNEQKQAGKENEKNLEDKAPKDRFDIEMEEITAQMREVPAIHHAMMSFYYDYIHKNSKMIENFKAKRQEEKE